MMDVIIIEEIHSEKSAFYQRCEQLYHPVKLKDVLSLESARVWEEYNIEIPEARAGESKVNTLLDRERESSSIAEIIYGNGGIE